MLNESQDGMPVAAFDSGKPLVHTEKDLRLSL